MLRVGIVGASGYTGAELMRIIWNHPGMAVSMVTANQYRGTAIESLYPSLGGFYEGEFEVYDPVEIEKRCDVIFLGLPHGESMKVVPEIFDMGKKIVDLSADFRLKDPGMYEQWYGLRHECPGFLQSAVYGLTEINRDLVVSAAIVANPGCYPTAVLLGLLPLVNGGFAEGVVVIDAKSGVSGAGRKPTLETHLPQCAESVTPYSVSGHRHLPEMTSMLERGSSENRVGIVFIPHLVPMSRGILCTMYVPVNKRLKRGDVLDLYEAEYGEELFIGLLEGGKYPATKAVLGSNRCHIGIEVSGTEDMVVVMTAIDNLVKGAAGQAVQNMNLMCGLPEETGLCGPGIFP